MRSSLMRRLLQPSVIESLAIVDREELSSEKFRVVESETARWHFRRCSTEMVWDMSPP